MLYNCSTKLILRTLCTVAWHDFITLFHNVGPLISLSSGMGLKGHLTQALSRQLRPPLEREPSSASPALRPPSLPSPSQEGAHRLPQARGRWWEEEK